MPARRSSIIRHSKVLDEIYADGSLQKIFLPYARCLLPAPYKVTTGPIPAPKCGRTVP